MSKCSIPTMRFLKWQNYWASISEHQSEAQLQLELNETNPIPLLGFLRPLFSLLNQCIYQQPAHMFNLILSLMPQCVGGIISRNCIMQYYLCILLCKNWFVLVVNYCSNTISFIKNLYNLKDLSSWYLTKLTRLFYMNKGI